MAMPSPRRQGQGKGKAMGLRLRTNGNGLSDHRDVPIIMCYVSDLSHMGVKFVRQSGFASVPCQGLGEWARWTVTFYEVLDGGPRWLRSLARSLFTELRLTEHEVCSAVAQVGDETYKSGHVQIHSISPVVNTAIVRR